MELPDGRAVLRFDLKPFAGKRIYRARLLCERDPIDGRNPDALINIEIFPLKAPHEPDVAAKADGRPLKLLPPWYRSFNMTTVVRNWVAGIRPNHGLYVKSFPGWRPWRTPWTTRGGRTA